MGNFSSLANDRQAGAGPLGPGPLASLRPTGPAAEPTASEQPRTDPGLEQSDALTMAGQTPVARDAAVPSSPFNFPPARRPLPSGALSATVGLTPADDPQRRVYSASAGATSEASEPKKKGFFDIIVSILKAILDLILAPFRFLLGLFGIGSSSKETPKLTMSEKVHGRAITLTPAHAPDTGAMGPYPVHHYAISLPTRDGKHTAADVYVPDGQGPFPSLIHAYGLAGSKEKHAGTASHYASWGMVVVVPQLPHGSDSPSENAPELANWVQWIESRPPELPPNLYLERGVGLSGHSFGGLTSVLAGNAPGVGAVVALDPADAWGVGKEAAPGIRAPSAFIMGERSFANQLGNGNDIYAAAGGDKQLIKVNGAQHTDFENSETDGPKNQANETAMKFATGFMLYQLTGLPEYAAYAKGGAEVQAEAQQKLIETR